MTFPDGYVQRPEGYAYPKDWNGVDRRQQDPWRHDMEQRMERIESTVKCIKTRSDSFEETYGELLRETLEARASRSRLWAVATEELVKKGIWAALAVVAGAVLIGTKESLKRWLFS